MRFMNVVLHYDIAKGGLLCISQNDEHEQLSQKGFRWPAAMLLNEITRIVLFRPSGFSAQSCFYL